MKKTLQRFLTRVLLIALAVVIGWATGLLSFVVNNLIELSLEGAVLLVVSIFVAYWLSGKDILFSRLETGNIKYVYNGNTLSRVIADILGKHIENYKLVDGDQEKTWLQKKFGVYWLGIPFVTSVKKFTIERKKEANLVTKGAAPETWIQDLGDAEVDSLRGVIVLPFLLREVELGDRNTVDLLVVGEVEVVDTYIPVPVLKGKFLRNMNSILRARVDDILKGTPTKPLTMDEFLLADKGEKGILKELKNPSPGTVSEFNATLEKHVGFHLRGITIPMWDPSDEKVRQAMIAKFIAEKEREVAIVAADAYARQLGVRNEADALAQERLAKARAARVKAILEELAAKDGTPDEVVRAAAKILQAESLINLTTYVEGGGSQTVVPVGGSTI